MGLQYILLLTYLITLSEVCILVYELFRIKLKPGQMIMKSSLGRHSWLTMKRIIVDYIVCIKVVLYVTIVLSNLI